MNETWNLLTLDAALSSLIEKGYDLGDMETFSLGRSVGRKESFYFRSIGGAYREEKSYYQTFVIPTSTPQAFIDFVDTMPNWVDLQYMPE